MNALYMIGVFGFLLMTLGATEGDRTEKLIFMLTGAVVGVIAVAAYAVIEVRNHQAKIDAKKAKAAADAELGRPETRDF